MCHVACIRCQVLCVMCHLSHGTNSHRLLGYSGIAGGRLQVPASTCKQSWHLAACHQIQGYDSMTSAAGRRFCGYRKRTKIVIADTTLLDQDGRGGHSEQPIVDIPEATKDM